MSTIQRISAALGYIPVVGWIYVFFLQRKNSLAVFHLKQSIGIILSILGFFIAWAVVAWVVTWIPYGDIFGLAGFAMVIVVLIIGVIDWIIGIVNALRGLMNEVPMFGSWAARLPI
jgi:uncharacterized membrane protein